MDEFTQALPEQCPVWQTRKVIVGRKTLTLGRVVLAQHRHVHRHASQQRVDPAGNCVDLDHALGLDTHRFGQGSQFGCRIDRLAQPCEGAQGKPAKQVGGAHRLDRGGKDRGDNDFRQRQAVEPVRGRQRQQHGKQLEPTQQDEHRSSQPPVETIHTGQGPEGPCRVFMIVADEFRANHGLPFHWSNQPAPYAGKG